MGFRYLCANVSNECPGQLKHAHSLSRASAVRYKLLKVDEVSDPNTRPEAPLRLDICEHKSNSVMTAEIFPQFHHTPKYFFFMNPPPQI